MGVAARTLGLAAGRHRHADVGEGLGQLPDRWHVSEERELIGRLGGLVRGEHGKHVVN